LVIESHEILKDLKVNRDLNLSDWDLVHSLIGLDKLKENVDNLGMISLSSPIPENFRDSYISFRDDDVLSETRFRIVSILRRMFWKKFENCQLNAQVKSSKISLYDLFLGYKTLK